MRPQHRQSIFVACEGRSERGYIRWIDRLARSCAVPVAITAKDMRGGSAIQVARNSVKFLQRRADRIRVFHKKYILLDFDLTANSEHELGEAAQIAERYSICVIWQNVCHECFLLKHFLDTERLNPTTSNACSDALRSVWPDYRKGMDATDYERKLSLDNLICARGNLPELDAFLNEIGWN